MCFEMYLKISNKSIDYISGNSEIAKQGLGKCRVLLYVFLLDAIKPPFVELILFNNCSINVFEI